MIVITYPFGFNWFYERLAQVLGQELKILGTETVAIPAHELPHNSLQDFDVILVIAPAESAENAKEFGVKEAFVDSIQKFSRRILVNYDSINSHWFFKNFELGNNLFTDIFDICAVAQTKGSCHGLLYHWIPEAVWLRPVGSENATWSSNRIFPWAVIGQENAQRVSLVAALLKSERPNGFVYVPPLKPYTGKYGGGVSAENLHKILTNTDYYIWNSYHFHPYHEGLRAIQAVSAGAIPAKIDPLHTKYFADLPWVYPSLSKLFDAHTTYGAQYLFDRARRYLSSIPSLGRSFHELIHS